MYLITCWEIHLVFSLALFRVVLLTLLINKPDPSRDLTILMISFIFLFEIITVVTLDPNIFFWIAASVTDTVAIKTNGIKTQVNYNLCGKLFSSLESPITVDKSFRVTAVTVLLSYELDNFMLKVLYWVILD